jgi:hypothetical protein
VKNHYLNRAFVFISFLWLCFAIFFVAPIDFEAEQQEADLYCEMVATYNQTGGQYGWPDYKKTFDKYCEVSK